MKKFIKKILVAVLLCFCIFLPACGQTPPPTNPDTEQGTGTGTGTSSGTGTGSGNEGTGTGTGTGNEGTGTGGNENEGGNTGNEGGSTGNEGDQNPEPVDPEVAARQAVYANLYIFLKDAKTSNSFNFYSLYNTYELEVIDSSTSDVYYDYSETNITPEIWETFASANDIVNTHHLESLNTTTTGFGENFTGYNYTKYVDNPEILDQAVTVHDNKLITLKGELYGTYASWVGADYVENIFTKYNLDDKAKTIAVLEAIATTANHSDLTNKLETALNGYNAKFDPDMMAISGNTEVSLEFKTLENSKYELIINTLLNANYNTQYSNDPLLLLGQYTISFDNNGITSIYIKQNQRDELGSYDRSDLLWWNQWNTINSLCPSGSKIYRMLDTYVETTINFKEYNEERIPDINNYNLTQVFSASYVHIEHYSAEGVNVGPIYHNYIDYTKTLSENLRDMYNISGETHDFYWDLEKTQPIDPNMTIPSYKNIDIFVFAKATA
jgi:hypothetical protein